MHDLLTVGGAKMRLINITIQHGYQHARWRVRGKMALYIKFS